MSIASDLLKELWDTEFNYKGSRVNIFGVPKIKKYKKQNLYSSVSRLKKDGLIENCPTGLILSKKGRKYVERKFNSLKKFNKTENVSNKRDLIVMFDIPEEKKAHREWLRWHLKKFNYIMVQRSVWAGPSPLPKEFSNYLKEIKLDKCIKTFKLAKPYK